MVLSPARTFRCGLLTVETEYVEVSVKVEKLEVDDKENVENQKAPISARRRKSPIKIEYDEEPDVKTLHKDVKKAVKRIKKDEWEDKSTEEEMREVCHLLSEYYGIPRKRTQGDSKNACGRKRSILDACIAVILSQNTSNKNSSRASAALRAAYPDLNDMREADPSDIEEVIRSGGLAKIKAGRIHNLLTKVHEDYGETSLEFLRDKSVEEVKETLGRYKGLGPKTISCVLLFTLDKEDLPVDTHVHRVSGRIGWAPPTNSREKTYNYLNKTIPPDLKYDTHVLFFKHGQQVCQSQTPKCGSCPIRHLCRYPEKTNTVVKVEIKEDKDI
ncbi:hypothetical protein PROFUN_00812 [Planoprotostelium fungivorum]|uniref:HhH-GPD domain-containing protein n=1 Tax=Planoprotostelium fungivorum TaxID=1890364 RepID=A0A2P6P048_9EUKA|nr:hypothetical protein PROFUN_00812 [Planoprotostelium fungivorum]